MNTAVGHAKRDTCNVYIGRRDSGNETIQNTPPGESWGNPYTLENYSRGASIRKFATLLETLLEEKPIYRLHVRDLAGKTLGCWCRQEREHEPACHGDVLAARAGQLYERMVSGGGQPCERGEHWLVQYRQWRECIWCGISGQSLSPRRAIDRTGAYLWPEDDDRPHHVSAVSDAADEATEPDHEPTESDESNSHSPVEESSGDANPGFKGGKSAAHEQNRAAVAPRHAPDDRSQRGGSG